ncbi:hypothetical protein B0H15DRAFT_954503 [Mycena belliarum]|uniref:Uncharacterized protein n=1 Tax=Mycena belliarum TaxID=1033014 RepID=A0AAD6XJA9_9AGAR|nr:hypothetical protein B0H15DRAFT_954503 [Mycena belliae]
MYCFAAASLPLPTTHATVDDARLARRLPNAESADLKRPRPGVWSARCTAAFEAVAGARFRYGLLLPPPGPSSSSPAAPAAFGAAGATGGRYPK